MVYSEFAEYAKQLGIFEEFQSYRKSKAQGIQSTKSVDNTTKLLETANALKNSIKTWLKGFVDMVADKYIIMARTKHSGVVKKVQIIEQINTAPTSLRAKTYHAAQLDCMEFIRNGKLDFELSSVLAGVFAEQNPSINWEPYSWIGRGIIDNEDLKKGLDEAMEKLNEVKSKLVDYGRSEK